MCKIVKETCEEIWNALMPEYVKAPSSENEWKETSKQFEQLWNFPTLYGMSMLSYFVSAYICAL